jgi:hypothetical protein
LDALYFDTSSSCEDLRMKQVFALIFCATACLLACPAAFAADSNAGKALFRQRCSVLAAPTDVVPGTSMVLAVPDATTRTL